MAQQTCFNCGQSLEYEIRHPIDEHLQRTWGINDQLRGLFNKREGQICLGCGINTRSQGLAQAILRSKFGYGASSLRQWVGLANERGLSVCELNACHELHKTFAGLMNYTYAEYGTDSEQNIEQLTYGNGSFDLVVHSETLEHVSDPRRAMDECRRVIKDDGLVLFTTPIIWNRRTRQRARHHDDRIEYLLEPSYHGQQTDDYLVCYEYGRDIDHLMGVTVCLADPEHQNYIFASGKTPDKISGVRKLGYRITELIAQA